LLAFNHYQVKNYKYCEKSLKNLKKLSEKVECNPEIESAAKELYAELDKWRVNGELHNNNFEDMEYNGEERMNQSNDSMNID
jgi:hypothetical protein